MKTLLQLNTSLFAAAGQSTQLAQRFVKAWQEANPGAKVVIRDIGREPVPHLTAERFAAFLATPESRTAEQQAITSYSDVLIDELRRADVIVIGLPMYNFGVPSSLKAYIDHIARAGITFRYTALDGKLKELKIPIANRHQAERILANGERVDGSSLFKGMVETALSDLYVVPIYKTAFLNPFDEGSLDLMCRFVTREGQLAPFALDTILNNAATLFRKTTGAELHALGELIVVVND